MTLVGETARKRYVRQRSIGCDQPFTRALDPPLPDVLSDCARVELPNRAGEVNAVHAGIVSEH